MEILSVNNISKRFGKILALDNVSFTVEKGNIYGILGPNGSGKTTMLAILTDVVKQDSGSFRFFESDDPPHDLRKKIGTLLETPNFYHYLSAEDNLRIVAQIKGCGTGNIENVLKQVNLYNRRKSKFAGFSLGMKQRLAIAAALLFDPEVFILDEPTNGLDPEGIAEIRELIQNLGKAGKTVIMAGHLLDEIQKVCTHVLVIKNGNYLGEGSVEEILSKNLTVEIKAKDLDKLGAVLMLYNKATVKRKDKGFTLLYDSDSSFDPEELNKFCFTNDVVLTELSVKTQNLESFFLKLTNSQTV